MQKFGKYSIAELQEGQFEPGSDKRVYKNLLGITKKREMDKIEWEALLRTSNEFIAEYDVAHRFISCDIKHMHKVWLQDVYAWAGKYRQINLSKDDFPFAAAKRISTLMAEFEKNELIKYTPCCFKELNKIIEAIAVAHTELVLIHPFREGNGRIARLLSSLMALQAGLPPLDFGGIVGRKRQEYFAAVRSGLNRDYEPMQKIFRSVVKRTLKNFDGKK